jgi:hypothetical protein
LTCVKLTHPKEADSSANRIQLYQQLKGSDWRYDKRYTVTTNNVLLTGESTPHYTANVFGLSVAYTWFGAVQAAKRELCALRQSQMEET